MSRGSFFLKFDGDLGVPSKYEGIPLIRDRLSGLLLDLKVFLNSGATARLYTAFMKTCHKMAL